MKLHALYKERGIAQSKINNADMCVIKAKRRLLLLKVFKFWHAFKQVSKSGQIIWAEKPILDIDNRKIKLR